MKVYEFKNCVNQKVAEIHTDVPGYEGHWFVVFFDKHGQDYNLKGTNGTGEKQFNNEVSAIRSAKHYITS